MTNSPILLRSVLIYSICLPLAVFLGYMVASPLTWTTFGTVAAVLFALILPLLLRYHHPLLVLGWNAVVVIFFLPGSPRIWLPLVALSLAISIVRRAVDQQYRFISVRELTWPLIVLTFIILVTAEARGGIGLKVFGGGVYGGKRYIFLLGAIAGYFALTAQRIPPERAGWYIGLFLLGGATAVIGDAFSVASPSWHYIFWVFPPNYFVESAIGFRFAGVGVVCSVFFSYMLAKHGVQGTFSFMRPWRFVLFSLFAVGSLLGGFRSVLLTLLLTFCIQFYLEGLHRTRLLAVLVLGAALVISVSLPFVQRLPFGVQRALSVLPIEVAPDAKYDAKGSMEWRLNIWKAVLPQVPRYLLLGKGLAMTPEDYAFAVQTTTGVMKEISEDQNWAALSGDYHSGPLSVIIPFGIWGVIAFVWLMAAGIRVVYRNYRYGDPALRIINTFLFATFLTKVLIFLVIFGGFYSDFHGFVGCLGMSVCLNGGVAKPVPKPAAETIHTLAPAGALRPRSAFGGMA